MKIQAFTTGTVRISHHWQRGSGSYPLRLMRTLTDPHLTEPLPIWCFLIEHPEGLILIDTGISTRANDPVWFPPHIRLIQRAAPFQIDRQNQEIGPQLLASGFDPKDVRWVVLTHLHQDHDGGLDHFPNATFVVSGKEWDAAAGWGGRMAGYLNQRWPAFFQPTQVSFNEPDDFFGGRTTLTGAGDVYLVPTPGHSPGHLSVVVEADGQRVFFAGDSAYSERLLLEDALDGVASDAKGLHKTHQQIRAFAAHAPTIYLPSHEWAVKERLEQWQTIDA
jgi:N-acyl homoserine lactone hydrolase